MELFRCSKCAIPVRFPVLFGVYVLCNLVHVSLFVFFVCQLALDMFRKLQATHSPGASFTFGWRVTCANPLVQWSAMSHYNLKASALEWGTTYTAAEGNGSRNEPVCSLARQVLELVLDGALQERMRADLRRCPRASSGWRSPHGPRRSLRFFGADSNISVRVQRPESQQTHVADQRLVKTWMQPCFLLGHSSSSACLPGACDDMQPRLHDQDCAAVVACWPGNCKLRRKRIL